jgi:AmiR/NasT family two-component response regulator
MKLRGLDEDSAYRALRNMAMNSNRRIGEVARRLIEEIGMPA